MTCTGGRLAWFLKWKINRPSPVMSNVRRIREPSPHIDMPDAVTSDDKLTPRENPLWKCLRILALVVPSFGFGWILGRVNQQQEVAAIVSERDALKTRIETLQDPLERDLIRELTIGDDLSLHPQLSMLVDDVISPTDDNFDVAYQYLSTTKGLSWEEIPKLPKDGSNCEILLFDLGTIEHEGVRSYYVVTQQDRVLAIIIGEYWTV